MSRLQAALALHAPRTALTSTKTTYAAIGEGAARVARTLGDSRDRRVAILASPGPEFVSALFGVWQAGATGVVLSPLHPAAESRYFVADAGIETVLVTPDQRVRAEEIGVARRIDLTEVNATGPDVAIDASEDAPALMLYTSGTTGKPKGAVLSHANIVSNVEQAHAHIPFDPNWSFFCPLPMFHCFGLTGGVLLPIFTGHKTFLFPSPLQVKEIPKLIKETGANVFFATDTFAQQYARNAQDGDLNCIELMVCGAERVKPETRELYKTRFDVELLEGYGATEASPVIAVNIPGANKHGTVGQFIPGIEWRLEPVPGIDGGQKLYVRGPNVTRGYLDPTKPFGIDLLPQGWHDTGDVVDVDSDGFIRILGRVKRFAKVGGEMVSLNAVEAYAQTVWPDHLHAAVALPDSRKGERIILFTDHAGATSEELQAWCKANGASELAVPKRIVVVDEIPVLGSGKTDYVVMQRIAAERFAEAKAA